MRVYGVRVCFDTNVLVSAFLARGLCADLLRLVLRDMLRRMGKLPPAQIAADDEWVLASAVLAEADLVVSGDQGVLACTTCPLPLLTPRACWQHLRGPG